MHERQYSFVLFQTDDSSCTIILSFLQRALCNEDTAILSEAPYDALHLRRIYELCHFVWHDTLKLLRAMPT